MLVTDTPTTLHWLYEEGIGEARAALVRGGRIVEAQIEREDKRARAGGIHSGRLVRTLIARKRGIVRLDSGEMVLIEPIPPKVAEGAPVRVEVLREAIAEPGLDEAREKLAKGRIAQPGVQAGHGPSLLQRLQASGVPIVPCPAHEADRMEAAGWSELLAEAMSGEVGAEDAALRIFPTPAMTLIDVDGAAPPAQLGPKGAKLAAQAIARMCITGSIGIDLPTMNNKDERLIAAAQIDKYLPQPFERTAVNGFGFVQIIRKRERPSLMELLRADPVRAASMAALRAAERQETAGGGGGPVVLTVPAAVAKDIRTHPDWIKLLERRRGGSLDLRIDDALALGAHHAH
ncbi:MULTISPECIES: ribonuclease [unclassified Sphingobium]|uniref:ribonuclease n=1 Tax=unclassified Sphingobium TaxID=2611147 RepID=UPI0022253BBD|nr:MULTISPECIES: ribonuclease [unclassified Sphingobium]